MNSPLLDFGMQALAIALRAKTGIIRDADSVDLAVQSLTSAFGQSDVRDAVVGFIKCVKDDPVGAGDQLQSFVEDWTRRHAPPPPPRAYPWQDRADMQ